MKLKNFSYICADPGIPVPGQKGASIHVASICKAFSQLGLGGDLYTIRPEGEKLGTIPIHAMELPPVKSTNLLKKPFKRDGIKKKDMSQKLMIEKNIIVCRCSPIHQENFIWDMLEITQLET